MGAPQMTQTEEIRVAYYDGDRETLRPLFAEAEDSAEQLDSYIADGRVLVASLGDEPVAHLQLVTAAAGVVELKNMAVVEHLRGKGIGRVLVEKAVSDAAVEGTTTMVVATAAADIGNLRFYQRCGFRFSAIERDAFTAATGYPDPILIDGIPLLDRVWLDRPTSRTPPNAQDHT
jgi:GNAT superfamily N-acetyltransferase